MGEDHGREGIVEDQPYLLGPGTPEIRIYSVLQRPDHESGEDEEGCREPPELRRQWLQKHGRLLPVGRLHGHDHGPTRV